ncbi:MAG: YraN family protein [bacterium]
MAEDYRQRLGEFGERLARLFLSRRGYEIILQNYRTRFGEIDIIAQKENRLFFVEVKTRTTDEFGPPQEAVTRHKLNRLRRTVEIYLSAKNRPNQNWQIDVISVEIDKANKKAKIRRWPIEG